MCAGGIPKANQTNPVDAIRAAMEMCEWMAHWKAEKQAKGLPAWEIRLGIHSGEVVAGIIGKKKFVYDIWGDAVNLASRMESSGEVGKINISGATYALVKDKFHCVFRGKIQAKNKGEVDMYFVEGVL
jgi:class 3 adenylate cyclase